MKARILLWLLVAASWNKGAQETLAFSDSLFGTFHGRPKSFEPRRNPTFSTKHSPIVVVPSPWSRSQQRSLSSRRYMVAAPEQRHNLDSADPFAVLGLNPYNEPIDKKVIKRAYKRLAKQYHPDIATNQHSSEYERKWASEQFSKINQAYETLCRNLEKELASRPHMWNPSQRKKSSSSYRNSHGVRPNPGQHVSRWNNPNNQDSSGGPFGGGYWVGANDFDLPKYDSVNYRAAKSYNNKGGCDEDETTKEYWNSPKVQGPESQYGSVSGEVFGGGHWVGADFHTKPRRDEDGEEDGGETYGEETIFEDFFTGNFDDFFTGATGIDYSATKDYKAPAKQPYNETGEESETIFNDFAAKVGSVPLKPKHSTTTSSQQVSTEVSEGAETVFHDFYSGEQDEAEEQSSTGNNNFEATINAKAVNDASTVFTDFVHGQTSNSATGSEDGSSSSTETTSDSAKGAGINNYEMYFATFNNNGESDNNKDTTNNGASGETSTSNGVPAAWEEYYAKANGNTAGQTNGATDNTSSNGVPDSTINNGFQTSNSASTDTEVNDSNSAGSYSWSMGSTSGSSSDSSNVGPTDTPNGVNQDSYANDIPSGSNGMSDDLKEVGFVANEMNYGSDSEATYGSNVVGYDYSNGQSTPIGSNGVDYNYATGGDSTDSNGASYDSNGASYESNGESNGASFGSYGASYESNEASYQSNGFSKAGTSSGFSSNGVRFDFSNGNGSPSNGVSNGASSTTTAEPSVTASVAASGPGTSYNSVNGVSSGASSTAMGEPSVTASVAASGPGTSYNSVNVAGTDSYGPETIVNDFVSGVTGAARSSGGGVFQDIVDVLKRNVEGNVGGSGYILGGDDPELNKLMHTGTVEDIGLEIFDTEIVVEHLTSKSEDLDSKIAQIQAELATCTKLANKIALEEMEAECRARKVVVEEFLPRAQERMQSLQTRYQDLIQQIGPSMEDNSSSSQQNPNGRIQGSSWRSNWPPSGRSKHSSSSPYFANGNQGPQMSAEAAARARDKRVKLLQVDDRFDRMIKDFEASRRGRFET